MRSSLLIGAVALLAGAALLGALSPLRADPLKVGDPAPTLSGVTDTGATLNLGDVYKQQTYTLVYFYPKAGTPGCTKEGCSLRDSFATLKDKGIAVVGVSTDTVDAQAKFKNDQQFPFPLMADPDRKIISAFGVPTRSIPALGTIALRQSFLIKDGKIVWTDYKVSPDKQVEKILKFVGEQGS
jgi:peroxiredoxin Q/BCP